MLFSKRSMSLVLAYATLFLSHVDTADAELLLGSLSTLAHQVSGDVYLLSERIMEVRGFSYDGTAPAAYFWADTNPTPSRNGQVLSDGSPSNGCALEVGDPELPASAAVTQRVEFPEGLTVRDFLGGSLSVWCEAFAANFGSIEFPDTIAESDIDTPGPELQCDVAGAELFLGSLSTIAHQVSGDVYLLSENVMEIRGFNYDGTAPAAYFWADTNPTPSGNGQVLSDGSPSSGCSMEVGDPELPASSSVTQRVEFPEGLTVRDFLGGSLSVWCEAFAANFGSIEFPDTLADSEIPSPGPALECGEPVLMVPDIAKTPEGYNCEPLNDDFQVRWKINGDNIDIELVGNIPDDAYMAFGVSGLTDSTFMIGADVIIADIPTSTGEARARDFFLDSRAQCSGVAGVCADTDGGFANDVSAVSGELDSGLTLVRYTRPLVPSNLGESSSRGEAVDKSIPSTPGTETYIVWALGPISPQTGYPNFHSIDYARADGLDVTLDFGRNVVDNCSPLVTIGEGTSAPTPSPPEPFTRPRLTDTVIDAHIGPSGGPRGYTAITGGDISWGIAWYLNGYLIPELVLTRGTTYTFRVNGGNVSTDDSNYHPFYITTSQFGGYFQLSPEERLEEEVLAGVVITERDQDTWGVTGFDVEGLAPICRYETTAATTPDIELSSFEDYAETLDMSCADDTDLMNQAGVITFTPDENTPDTIYYHCVTHFNLGFKIHVINEGEVFTTAPTATPTAPPDFSSFSLLELEGDLQGAKMMFKFNENDERADGKDTITVVYEAPVEGWVGWAVSNNGGFMLGSEAVIGLPDTGVVEKYNLNAQNVAGVSPMPVEKQTLIDASVQQSEDKTTLTFTKILEEEGEIPINLVGDNTFLAAWGINNNLAQHAHRGSFSASGESLTVREQSLWKLHGWLAAIAWSLLSPLAIASSILRQYFPGEGLWFQVHRGLNSMVVAFTLAAFFTAVAAINQETPSGASPKHFDSSLSSGHRTIGLVIFIFACLQAIGGLLRPHAPHAPSSSGGGDSAADAEAGGKPEAAPEEKTVARQLWEIGHKGIGLALLGLCWYQVKLGISTYSDIFKSGDDDSLLAALYAVIATLGAVIVIGYVLKFMSP